MDTFSVYGHEIVGKRHRAARIVDGVFQSVFNSEDEEPKYETSGKVGGTKNKKPPESLV